MLVKYDKNIDALRIQFKAISVCNQQLDDEVIIDLGEIINYIKLFFTLFILVLANSTLIFSMPLDGMEFLFGATNINAVVGNGGLTAGISKKGELTVLRYPTPSYYDQLNYKTHPFGRTMNYFGAQENMGSFAGILVSIKNENKFYWLRDNNFEITQKYFNDNTNILKTTFKNKNLALQIIQTDFIHKDKNILVRHYLINKENNSPVTAVSLAYYENFAPCDNKQEYYPVNDWMKDLYNDFAVVYFPQEQYVLHFLPQNKDEKFLKPLLNIGTYKEKDKKQLKTLQTFADNISKNYNKGIFIAVASDNQINNFSVGDDYLIKGTKKNKDAYYQAASNTLNKNLFNQGKSNSVIINNLSFNKNLAETTIFIAIENEPLKAKQLILEAKKISYEKLFAETKNYWEDIIKNSKLPNTEDKQIIKVCKRTLLSILVGTDKTTSSIVASISTQPPYAEDWPRDGAFINLALDYAGFTDLVTNHNYFYKEVQRKKATKKFPAGSFAMNYYSDGIAGGFIPFEIDEVGLAGWTMYEHSKFLFGSERKKYLKKIYPAIKLCADVFLNCVDEKNFLQCKANEDDNVELTQGLQGAISGYLALKVAILAGEENGDDYVHIWRWKERKKELEQAIIVHFFKEGKFNGASSSWVIFPAIFLTKDDEKIISFADSLFLEIEQTLNKENAGDSYIEKKLLALAFLYNKNSQQKDKSKKLENLIKKFFYEVPTPDTQHFGEVFITKDFNNDGKKEFENRVAVPHLWTASLAYLIAVMYYGVKLS